MSNRLRSYGAIYQNVEKSALVAPLGYVPDGTRRGVLYVHGANGNALSVYDPSFFNIPHALADAGYPVGSADVGDTTQASGTTSSTGWGNDFTLAALGTFKTRAQVADAAFNLGNGFGFKSDKVYIYAGSMGALPALNWLISLATPSSVCAGIVLAIPVLDLDDAYQANKGGFQASIAAAYAVTFPTAIPALATHSPVAYSAANLAKLAAIPMRIYAASDDPLASPTAAAQTWAARVSPSVQVVNLGAVGHSGTTVPPADVVAFFQANAA